MFKFLVLATLLSGGASAFACAQDLNGTLFDRLDRARARIVRNFSSTLEPSHLKEQLDMADVWEGRAADGLSEADRIELNAFVTVLELTPDPTPIPRFSSRGKADQETWDFYNGPF